MWTAILNALKVNVAAYGKDCAKKIDALWGKMQYCC
jgi:hypothetical protein